MTNNTTAEVSEAMRALAYRAIDAVSDAERETDWNIPTFGPTISEEMRAEYDELMRRTLAMQSERLKGDGEIFTLGAEVYFVNDDDPAYPVQLLATVVGEVEGWYEIRFVDESTAIVRPSRLRLRSLSPPSDGVSRDE